MNSDRKSRLDELFDRARKADPAAREELIEEGCGGDEELRSEVESLLRAHEEMGSFLDLSAAGALGALVPRLEPGDVVGAYRVVRLVAEGGGGAVYEAIQANPERRVALKVMRAGPTSERQRERFAAEARILARLKHPAIAPIYEAGAHETGRGEISWFALEYVEGSQTILAYSRTRGLRRRDRLALFARICDAIHHGHQQGVLHRDIKPGNLLVDRGGRPKVIDFGIARAVDDGVTEIAGTPPYMSPEQCAGEHLDVRSDVYSLGVVLYELASEKLPHELGSLTTAEARRRIRDEEAAPLRMVDSSIPRDVAAIASRALALEPDQRYVSAAALGEDVRRYLSHQPVAARPHVPIYVLGKFARRQRLAFGALLAVLVVSLAAAVITGRLAIRYDRARLDAEFKSYVANIAAASAAIRVSDVREAGRRLALTPEDLRDWEWTHLVHQLDMSERTISVGGAAFVALSPDGSRLVVSRQEGGTTKSTLWDRSAGRPVYSFDAPRRSVKAAGCSADGMRLALGYADGEVEVRSNRDGRILTTLSGHEGPVNAVVFAPDGGWIATGSSDATIRVWAEADTEPRILRGHTDRVIGLAVSPEGRQLVSGGREGAIRFWDPRSGALLASIEGAHEQSVESVDWSADGRLIASASRDRTARIWNAVTHEPLATCRGHENNVREVRIAPDGRTIATASWDRTVRIWSTADGSQRACLQGHGRPIGYVAYLPPGDRVLSFGQDGQAKEWLVEPRSPVPTLHGHRDLVNALAYAPDTSILASGSRDGSVRLWDPQTNELRRVLDQEEAPVRGLACGEFLHAAWTGGPLRTWRLPDGKLMWESSKHAVSDLAVTADGSTLVIANPDRGEVRFLDAADGSLLNRWQTEGKPLRLAITPRANRVATIGEDGRLGIWSQDGDRIAETLVADRGETVFGPALSPDGRLLATGLGRRVLVYDVPGLNLVGELEGHDDLVEDLLFSPSGSRLVSAARDATIRLWDVARLENVAVLQGHRHPVRSLAFTTGGHWLASGAGTWEGHDSVIRIWR